MASQNEKVMIPVPQAGLREDIDRTVSNSDMVVSGENIVSIDGTVRPRPCHKLSTLNADQGLSWALSWDALNEGFDTISVQGLDDGTNELLIASVWNQTDPLDWAVYYSDDEGATWNQTQTGLDSAQYRVTFDAFILLDTGSGWQLICTGIDAWDKPWFRYSFNVSTWLASPSTVSLNFQYPWGIWYWGNYDPVLPSSTFKRADLDTTVTYSGTPPYSGLAGVLWSAYTMNIRESTGNELIIKTEQALDPGDPNHVLAVFEMPPGANSGLGTKYITAGNGHVWVYWFDANGRPIICDYDWEEGDTHTTYTAYNYSVHGMDIIEDAGYNSSGDVIFVGGDKVVKFSSGTFTTVLLSASAEFKLYGDDGVKEFALGQSLFSSDDNWATALQLQSSPSADMRQMTFVEYSADPGNYNWFAMGSDPYTGAVNIYDMPDVPGNYGECTNIFQVDIPTDPYSIFNGTESMLMQFDRDSAQWINRSFGVFSDDTNYPDASVTYPGEFPNDSYYLSGTRGVNPVIFRAFETAGYTWILATNGVFPPCMMYDGIGNPGTPGTEDEFTPIGAATFDPNVGGVYGDVGFIGAPVAETMAIVGQRMVLGGIAGSQGNYGITFSDVGDHRVGWNYWTNPSDAWAEYAVLGDTPGKIVTIQEITALAAAIYKEDAIYHLVTQAEFLGQNAPFRYELIKSGIAGPCSQLSVVRMLDGRQAYIATDGGVYLYDGVNPVDTGRHIRKAIQKDLDEYNLGLSWGMMDPYNKLLWFFYPTQNGRTNRGIVLQVDQPPPWPAWRVAFPFGWDMATGGRLFNFSDRSIGSFGDVEIGAVPDALGDFASGLYEISLARHDNTWYKQSWADDGDYTDALIPITVKWTQGWEAIGDPFRFATAQECQHLISSNDQSFQIGFRLEAEQAESNDILVEDWEYIGPSSHYSRTTHRLTGKRFAASFRAAITRSFKWGGLGLYHSMRGLR